MILSYLVRVNSSMIMMPDLILSYMQFILFDDYAARVYQTFVNKTITIYAVRGEIRSDQHCLEVYRLRDLVPGLLIN